VLLQSKYGERKYEYAGWIQKMKSYNDIIGIEAEISGYRRSCLRATLLINKEMVAWNDSLQWNNNFLRSMSADCHQAVIDLLPSTQLLQWEPTYKAEDTNTEAGRATLPMEWSVTVTFADGTVFKSAGSRQYPREWGIFRKLIETATRVPFRIR
jgi:hypothetical protein